MAVEHSASEALRQRSRNAWHATLVRDLRTGEPEWRADSRDLIVALAPFHDCAVRLGMPVALSFRFAAWRGPRGLRSTVVAFGRRDDVTLRAFGWALEDTAFGPSYVSALAEIDVERLLRRVGRDAR